jgi:CubicO group peptidase (beta-lactamase class C family)
VPYEDYLAAHLFEPLGMARTTFDLSLASQWGLAGYSKRHGVVGAGPVPLSRGNNPAGGVLTTGRDVGHYLIAIMSSLEKAEIAQDTLVILLDGEPAARPARPDWRHSPFAADRAVWASYVGEYQTSDGSLRIYREGDRLLSAAGPRSSSYR